MANALDGESPFDLGGLMRWRAFVQRSAAERGYTQTRWHTFKRLDTIARHHERLPCFDDEMSGYQLGIGMSARSHLGYTVYRNPSSFRCIWIGSKPASLLGAGFPLDEQDRRTQAIARTLGDGKTLARAEYAAASADPSTRTTARCWIACGKGSARG